MLQFCDNPLRYPFQGLYDQVQTIKPIDVQLKRINKFFNTSTIFVTISEADMWTSQNKENLSLHYT